MNFSDTTLQRLSVHYIGNKSQGEAAHFSDEEIELTTDLQEKTGRSFLKRFENIEEKYRFCHENDLRFNEVYSYCRELFAGQDNFQQTAINIAQHLYQNTNHPKIKNGELYITFFSNVLLNGAYRNAIGIFKTESKSLFFEVHKNNRQFHIDYKEGIDLSRFEKGSIIFNTDEEKGFEVVHIDNQNRGEEAMFWKDNFLAVAPLKNEYHQTQQFLNITKQFVTQQLQDEYEVGRTDQIEFLNRSVDYFKKNETFDRQEFESAVFADTDVIESFRKFNDHYQQENNVAIEDQFEISTQAVKKQSRVFKNVIKLDKNFHIYVHGSKDLIEQGTDEYGRKFYKIYYEEEN